MNCGQFTCGAGFAGHGCGVRFAYNNTQPYVADETLLAPLRGRVAAEQLQLQQAQEGNELWLQARTMVIPLTIIEGSNTRSATESIVPSVHVLSTPMGDSNVHNLMMLLWDASDLAPHLTVLPDLIEVSLRCRLLGRLRAWCHSHTLVNSFTSGFMKHFAF
jgi:hypothetical protein